ncbi:MAG: RluA family pseudouridine synthase [Actinomycetales bacterium]|nr:RluA family pseudouridine synthase [Actinomycetales bacterium]
MIRNWPVAQEDQDGRIDSVLANISGLSRATCAGLIEQGRVQVNEKVVAKSHRVSFGDVIEVEFPDPEVGWQEPVAALPIVFSDSDLVVIDKPAGVAAHPSAGWAGPTVTGSLEAMGHVLTAYGPVERKGIVHRLDVGTSGLMVVAKSERAYVSLKDQFRDRTVNKIYHTLVQGRLDPMSGTIDAPIDRHPNSSYRFAVLESGRPSITHYDTLDAFAYASLLEVHLETGRTHQIRVHMSALRHPCCGDLTYGADPKLAARIRLDRQWLHAVKLGFSHPGTHDLVEFTSEYAPELKLALEKVQDL